MPTRAPLLLVLIALASGAPANAQGREHPGQVHLGDGAWGTPEEARERGLVEYRGRWFPEQLRSKLEKWERQDAKGLTWDDAYKARTKYYRVETNVPRFVFELEIAPFLDALGDTYTRVFREDFGLEGRAVKNKDLAIYGSFEEYSAEANRGEGPIPRQLAGFIVNGAELVVFYEETDPSQFYGTVFHEGAHQFFLSLLPGASLPIWLDEALATWFEGASYSRATQELTFSSVPATRLLRAQELLEQLEGSPEELFMNVPQPSFRADHYALAWSFLHYLLERPGEDSTEQFARFLRETNGSGSRPLPEVYERATGEDFDELAQGWREHVQSIEPPAYVPVWVVVDVTGEGVDVRDGDLVVSLDGQAVHGQLQFNELWSKRARDREVELVLIRSTPSFEDPYSSRVLVRTAIPADSEVQLAAAGGFVRDDSLRD